MRIRRHDSAIQRSLPGSIRSGSIALALALSLGGCGDGRDAESLGRAVDDALEEVKAGGEAVVEESERAIDQANSAVARGASSTREAVGKAVDGVNRVVGEASGVFNGKSKKD
jgi:hypothetical protein